ncbi:MAG: hypothetical protein AABM42_05140 [Actinomycetota bacterium]
MRIRKRYMLLAFASVAALAVGGSAFGNHVSNTSTLSGSKITPSTLPFNTYKPASLFVHTGTVYAHPNVPELGGKAKTVTLYFDDDGKLNLTGIPKCTANFGAGTTIAQAWERCGPGADTAPEVNAYMSPPTAVSGKVSTAPPSNFNGCTLVFNGPTNAQGNPTVYLFARVTFAQTSNCASPASNSTGNTTVTLRGTITDEPDASDFGKRLTVPNIDLAPLPLDDFTATVKRASVISARCHDANKILNIKATFQYSGSGQPTDTANATQACTIG